MKKLIALLSAAMISVTIMSGCNSEKVDRVDIGIIQLAEHPALDASREGFIQELKEAGYIDGENIDIEIQNAQGDQSNLSTISQKFVSDDKDLILAIATPAAQAMAGLTDTIPILVTACTDPAASDLVQSNEMPNTNVSGTSDLTPIREQIELLVNILPDVSRLTIMYSSGEQNSLIQADIAEEVALELGLDVARMTVTNTNEVAQAVESVVTKTDAIYIPTDNVFAQSMNLVESITTSAGIPVIAGEENMTRAGGLASVAINYTDLGRLTGKMAIDIIKGADVKTMPIGYLENPQLIINTTIADKLNITISDEILQNAKIVGANVEDEEVEEVDTTSAE